MPGKTRYYFSYQESSFQGLSSCVLFCILGINTLFLLDKSVEFTGEKLNVLSDLSNHFQCDSPSRLTTFSTVNQRIYIHTKPKRLPLHIFHIQCCFSRNRQIIHPIHLCPTSQSGNQFIYPLFSTQGNLVSLVKKSRTWYYKTHILF